LLNVWIEMQHPQHGLERFRIKVIKKYNLAANTIQPKILSRSSSGINCLYVGRNVSEEEVKNYLVNYFREKNLLEAITKMKMQT